MKNYVIDTNVLIQAPNALWAFQENRIVIPLVVVEELDSRIIIACNYKMMPLGIIDF